MTFYDVQPRRRRTVPAAAIGLGGLVSVVMEQAELDFGEAPRSAPELVGLHDAPLSTLWRRPAQVAQGEGPGGVAGG